MVRHDCPIALLLDPSSPKHYTIRAGRHGSELQNLNEMVLMVLDSSEIKEQLKSLILSSLKITDVVPEEMDDDMLLLDGDYEIDSIDILQLIVEIEKKFGIKLVGGRFERSTWQTIDTLAEAIQAKMKEQLSQ
jgi:acyl carrier protein